MRHIFFRKRLDNQKQSVENDIFSSHLVLLLPGINIFSNLIIEYLLCSRQTTKTFLQAQIFPVFHQTWLYHLSLFTQLIMKPNERRKLLKENKEKLCEVIKLDGEGKQNLSRKSFFVKLFLFSYKASFPFSPSSPSPNRASKKKEKLSQKKWKLVFKSKFPLSARSFRG